MKKIKTNIERNRLDYILTDILPVEVSELFSFGKMYDYLISRQVEVNEIIEQMKKMKDQNAGVPFEGTWGNWASIPLKYNILKGVSSNRELNIVQPLAALNIYFFIECYQKEILDSLEEHACFSLRYHRKNSNLFYKKRVNRISAYFEKTSEKVERSVLQQTGAYFKIHKFNSVSAFTNSRLWQQCNFRYNYFAKIDYKACFDSIYTHTYKWIIEKNTIDSKNAKNSNILMVIDRILQNINGRSSNGLIVGPEFSRMMAEILLQHIDVEVKRTLSIRGIEERKDYRIFRYVDDIYIFANSPEYIDIIIKKIEKIAQKYLLRLNELKSMKTNTPVVISTWLGRTRLLADRIASLFYKKSELKELELDCLLKKGYISIDRLKDDFTYLVHDFPKEQRYIVSYLLSTLLNNISNKKDGYMLFEKNKTKRAFVLLELAMYIYSFNPCFEHTQKIISMLVYMDDELKFNINEKSHKKLQNIIRRYAFIFENGNMNDLCNWFIFFFDYKISLTNKTERIFEEKLISNDNPILWANYLIYSKYYQPYFDEVKQIVEKIVEERIEQIGTTEILLQREFWYIIVFNNCPYLSEVVKDRMKEIISLLYKNNTTVLAHKIINLICEFMLQSKQNQFFYWGYYKFSASKQLTFRTYQRTLFKQYKSKKLVELYGSLDS